MPIEDKIKDLKIHRLGFGPGVQPRYVMAGGGAGPGYENTGEYDASPLASGR